MARTIAWNGTGNSLLTAAQRAQVETAADTRGPGANDRMVILDTAAPAHVQFDGNAVFANGVRVGTLTGAPTLSAGKEE